MSIDINKIIADSKTAKAFVAGRRGDYSAGYTAFGVSVVANETLAKLGRTERFTSQQFYGYAKSGKINGVKDSTQRFNEAEVMNFVARLIAGLKK